MAQVGISSRTKSAGPRPESPRAARRRQELAEVVMQLIKERGFDAVSVSSIAEKAGISVGGLYRYIKTKSDLLEMVCYQINSGLRERMAAAASEKRGIAAKLSAAVTVYWETCWDAPEPILLAIREWQSLPKDSQRRLLREEIEIAELLADLIRAGVASDDFCAVDERLLAHEMILLAQMRALKGWALQGRTKQDVLTEHLRQLDARLKPA